MPNSNTTIRLPRAVGKQPPENQLGWSFFDWFSDYQKPTPLRRTPYADSFWNAGVNMAYGRETAYQNTRPASGYYVSRSGGDTGLKPKGYRKKSWSLWGPQPDIGVETYNRVQAEMAYGNVGAAQAELGDLFNDIMGAVIPGWDLRPQALKNIVIKPDPTKIMQQVQKVAPNAGAQIVQAANANGLNVYVNTPAGQVEVTPETAQLYYGNYAFITKAQGVMGSIPTWVWLAGAGVVGLVIFARR